MFLVPRVGVPTGMAVSGWCGCFRLGVGGCADVCVCVFVCGWGGRFWLGWLLLAGVTVSGWCVCSWLGCLVLGGVAGPGWVAVSG